MTNRQFIACAFRKGDTRTYTYHNDREPVAVGDRVVVTTARGPSTVFVSALIDEVPKFETKPIVGLAPQSPDPGVALLTGLEAMTREDERERPA
jgi:hypothetical protein